MFRAIGLVIVLYALTHFFAAARVSFEQAVVATFNTVETAAILAEEQLQMQR